MVQGEQCTLIWTTASTAKPAGFCYAPCAQRQNTGAGNTYTLTSIKLGPLSKRSYRNWSPRQKSEFDEFIQERSLTESKRDKIEAKIAYKNKLTKQRDVVLKEFWGMIQQEIMDEYSDILNGTSAKVQWATHIRNNIHKQVTEASMYKLLQMREELLIKITDVVEKTFPLIVFPGF